MYFLKIEIIIHQPELGHVLYFISDLFRVFIQLDNLYSSCSTDFYLLSFTLLKLITDNKFDVYKFTDSVLRLVGDLEKLLSFPQT